MWRRFLFFLLFVAIVSCQRRLIPESSTIELSQPSNTVLIPTERSNPIFQGTRYPEALVSFYESRKGRLFWLENDAKTARGDSLTNIIRSVRKHGLLPQDYHAQEISGLVLMHDDETKLRRLDIVLTDAFLSIANDLQHGRWWDSNTSSPDSVHVQVLTDSLKAGEIGMALRNHEPEHGQYHLLKDALNVILDSVNVTDRNLLLQGITIDSIAVHRKVQSIEINMERWRKENAALENSYTWVNIPSFTFYFVENHKVVLESAVIVGTPSTPTPVFSSMIECFTIFPYWYMPRKIAVREYLPVIKRDTSFLSRNNFDVLDKQGNVLVQKNIDWNKYNENNFPFVLRQREGKENSLGLIKFVFDNPYAVFLHDTNSKRLFRQKVRAFSHGCIRLEKAIEFAHHLSDHNRTDVSSRALSKYFAEQKRTTISLVEPIPIYIRYFTCEVRDGSLRFYPDIYTKDTVLVNKLYHHEAL